MHENSPSACCPEVKRWRRATSLMKMLIMLLIVGTFAIPTSVTAQCPNGGALTIDGNPCDWSNLSGYAIKAYVPDNFGNTTDNQFTQGSADPMIAADLRWNIGQTKDKGDIANAAAVLYDNKLYFAGDRISNNGAAQIGFWFYLNGTGPVTQNGVNLFAPPHAVGDLFVLADFTNGGTNAVVTVYQWVGTGGNVPNTNGTLSTTNLSSTVAINNASAYPVPTGWQFPSANYSTNMFYEGVIDLANLNITTPLCISSFLLETRSSPSITSSLEDFAFGAFNVKPSVSINNQSVCAGQSATFTATATGGIGPLTYNFTYNGSTTSGSSNTFTIPNASATGPVTVTVTGAAPSTGGNTNATCTSDQASGTLTVTPTPAAPTGGPASRCGTGTVSLTASGCSGTLNWYAAAAGGPSLGTGTPFVTPSISQTTTYYVSCTSGAGCESGRTAVIATVNPIPAAPTGGPASRCGTGTVNLTASGCTGTLNWYAAAAGGPSLGTGTPFVTPSISQTTTYYVSCTSGAGCESGRTAVIATVNPIPAAPTGGPASRCGEGTVSLTATGCTGTLNWYAAAAGGPSLGTGTPFVTPSISQTTTYYVSCTSAEGCESARTAVIATVNPGPAAPTGGPASRCGTGTVSLTASGCSGTLNWYAAAAGGPSLGTGTPFVTPSISQTTTYYVSCTSGAGCESGRTAVIATVNPIPAAPTGGPASRCGTGTVSLTASGCTGTLNWYAAAAGGPSLGTGTPFVTPSISQTTTYYVSCTSGAGCESGRTAVIATVNPIPAAPTGGPASRCGEGTVSLTATGCTGTLNWYAAAAGGPSLGTGTPFVTPSISQTTTYYVSCTSAEGCESARTAVIATVNPGPAAPTGGPASRCGTGTVSLTASGCSGTLNWYAAAAGGPSLGTGTPFVTPSISQTTTYYVSCTSGAGCESGRTAVIATVNPIPAAPTGGPASRCGTGTVSLTASGCSGTLNWYAAAAGGPSLGTGTPFVTPSISQTTTYYVSCTSGAGCESGRTAVIATVNPIPAAPTGGPASRCGEGTVSLTATGCTGTLNWYAAAAGGPSLGTGTPFVTPSISQTTTYYVSCTSAEGCESARTAVIATVNPGPAAPTGGPASRCGTGTVSLTASGCSGTLNWYAAAAGGPSLGTGTPFVTPSISQTTTYYVSCTSGAGCESGRTAVIATVNPIPAAPTGGPASRCGTGTVSLTASGCSGTLNWYAAAAGGPSLGTGTPFVTPSISQTTTYYVSCTSGGCESGRTAVIATVNPIPTTTATNSGPICVGGSFNLFASNSLAGATFSWVGPNGYSSMMQNPPARTNATLAMGGLYTVTVSLNGCSSTSSTTVGIAENPIIYVPFATPFCAGDPAKGTVTLPNSQLNVNYQLVDDGLNNVQAPKAGTGAALVWTGLDAGGYLVRATGTGPTNCANLTQPAVVVENPLPNIMADSKEICLGDCVALTATPAGGTWSGTGVTGSQFCSTGLAAGSYVVTYTVTNPNTLCQASGTATIMVRSCGGPICTYTQGYFGNANGSSCDGTTGGFSTAGLIQQSLANQGGSITIGRVSATASKNRSVLVNNNATDIACVIAKLPGGGGAKELNENTNSGICNIPYVKNGRINNVLLSQTLTLALNVGITNPSTLSNFALQAGVLATAVPEGGCGSSIPKARVCNYSNVAPYELISVTNEYTYRTISTAIYNALTTKTVGGLLDLANDALANTDGTVGTERGVPLADISNAVAAINEVFDECRIFIGWDVAPCAPTQPAFTTTRSVAGATGVNDEIVSTKLNVTAFPNPFTDQVKFEIISPVTGKGQIDVYNMTGQKLETINLGQVFAGRGRIVSYNVAPVNRANLIYVLTVGTEKVIGKLMNIK